MLVRAALMAQPLPSDWGGAISRGAAATFPITATDLMPALQGPALGNRLAELTDRWLVSDLRLTRGELLSGA